MTDGIDIRALQTTDGGAVLALFQQVAAVPGSGLAREPDEFSHAYVGAVIARAQSGVALGAFDGDTLLGIVHCVRMEPRQFAHVMTDLTVAVSPLAQGRGVGSRLFAALFDTLAADHPGVNRVELVSRSGNEAAIRLYARLGFVEEGRFAGRVILADGTVEDDIPMAKRL